jgi:hypothetical protein
MPVATATVGVAAGLPWFSRRATEADDVDSMAAAVPGLVAPVERLAGESA